MIHSCLRFIPIKFWIVTLLSAFLISDSLADTDRLPIDSYIQHGDYLELKLSPDGVHMAGRMRKEGTVMLVVLKTDTQELVGGARPRTDSMIHSITWANNERILFEYAEKISLLDRPIATGELLAINIDGTKSEVLYGFRAGDEDLGSRVYTKKDTKGWHEIISILRDDPNHILIAEYPWAKKSIPMISKLNIYTGKKKKIERVPFPHADILADKKGVAKFTSWYDEDGGFHAASRDANKTEWREIKLLVGVERVGKPVQINRAGDKVYLRTDLGEKEISSLVELDLNSGKAKELFTQKDVDLSFWENDIKTNEPVVGVSYPDVASYQYAETPSEMKSIHKLLAKAFKGQDIFITSHTSDGKKLMVSVNSDINPGEFYLFDTVTKNADFLWANSSWIDPRKMMPMKNIEITARDGINLHALLTLPAKTESKPPLIVIPHGGPHGVRDHWSFNSEVQLLASRGFAVLQVNFRGSGGFGQSFEEKGYGEWGGKMIDDIVDSTKWLIDEGTIDPQKVCIYGASYGGYAAMMAAIKAPNLYRCAIGYVGVYDLSIMYSTGDISTIWGGESYLKKVIGADKAVLSSNSPTSHAEKIKSNVMLIHGEKDRRAPIKHAMLMRKALKAVDKDPVWLTFDKAGHGVWDVEKSRVLYTKLLEFLNDNLDMSTSAVGAAE